MDLSTDAEFLELLPDEAGIRKVLNSTRWKGDLRLLFLRIKQRRFHEWELWRKLEKSKTLAKWIADPSRSDSPEATAALLVLLLRRRGIL